MTRDYPALRRNAYGQVVALENFEQQFGVGTGVGAYQRADVAIFDAPKRREPPRKRAVTKGTRDLLRRRKHS